MQLIYASLALVRKEETVQHCTSLTISYITRQDRKLFVDKTVQPIYPSLIFVLKAGTCLLLPHSSLYIRKCALIKRCSLLQTPKVLKERAHLGVVN